MQYNQPVRLQITKSSQIIIMVVNISFLEVEQKLGPLEHLDQEFSNQNQHPPT